MMPRKGIKIQVGSEDVEKDIAVDFITIGGKREAVLTIESSPSKIFLDKKGIDNFISKLKKMKKVM